MYIQKPYGHMKNSIMCVCCVRVCNVNPMDWEKYLEEIELDVMEEPHKISKFNVAQKEEDSRMM